MLKPVGSAPFMQLSGGGVRVLFPAKSLLMVLPFEELLAVPQMRQGVAGVIVRGSRVIPVFALSALVTEAETSSSVDATSIAVVEQDGALAGFLVESTEPARSESMESEGISDGIRLLATAGIFTDPLGDEPAAHAASGAI